MFRRGWSIGSRRGTLETPWISCISHQLRWMQVWLLNIFSYIVILLSWICLCLNSALTQVNIDITERSSWVLQLVSEPRNQFLVRFWYHSDSRRLYLLLIVLAKCVLQIVNVCSSKFWHKSYWFWFVIRSLRCLLNYQRIVEDKNSKISNLWILEAAENQES